MTGAIHQPPTWCDLALERPFPMEDMMNEVNTTQKRCPTCDGWSCSCAKESPPMVDVTDAAVEARFFIDHGMIHDRKTGKHVTTDDDSVFCDGRVACCALLNELARITARQPKPDRCSARPPVSR